MNEFWKSVIICRGYDYEALVTPVRRKVHADERCFIATPCTCLVKYYKWSWRVRTALQFAKRRCKMSSETASGGSRVVTADDLLFLYPQSLFLEFDSVRFGSKRRVFVQAWRAHPCVSGAEPLSRRLLECLTFVGLFPRSLLNAFRRRWRRFKSARMPRRTRRVTNPAAGLRCARGGQNLPGNLKLWFVVEKTTALRLCDQQRIELAMSIVL